MDYNLAALKLMCSQLKIARETQSSSTSPSFTLRGIHFQRAWLQGILVSAPNEGSGRYLLDDGSGIIELIMSGDFCNGHWEVGMYVMVVGAYLILEGNDVAMIKVHKIVDLSMYPDREAMWYLEVIEAYKLFYHPLVQLAEEEE